MEPENESKLIHYRNLNFHPMGGQSGGKTRQGKCLGKYE